MEPGTPGHLSERDYFALENASPERHERIDGRMVQRAPSCFQHSIILTNLACALGNALAGKPFIAFGVGLRVHVAATGLIAYPDVMVSSRRPELHPLDEGTIRDPILLAEVLGETTEAFDRGRKFHHYQSLPSLREYLLVSQKERVVERYERIEGDNWRYTRATGSAVVPLSAVETELPLDEVYLKVDFEAA